LTSRITPDKKQFNSIKNLFKKRSFKNEKGKGATVEALSDPKSRPADWFARRKALLKKAAGFIVFYRTLTRCNRATC